MKSTKILLVVVISSILIFLNSGCTILKASTTYDAEKTITDHFKYKSNNDLERFETTISEDLRHLDWNFDNIASIEILKLELDTNKNVKNSYIEYGRGELKNVVKNDIKVFLVKYEILLHEETMEQKNGIYERYYFLIKSNREWLIDDFGM